jgi:ribosomal protein L6P/L9E
MKWIGPFLVKLNILGSGFRIQNVKGDLNLFGTTLLNIT